MEFEDKNRFVDWLVVFIFLCSFVFLFQPATFSYSLLLFGFGLFFIFLGFLIIRKQDRELDLKMAMALPGQYAGLWKRLLGNLIDLGILVFIQNITYKIFGKLFYEYINLGILTLVCLVIQFYMLKKWGQSPGKMLVGIKVVRTNHESLTLKNVLFRGGLELIFVSWVLLKGLLIQVNVITFGLFVASSVDKYSFPGNFFRTCDDFLTALIIFWFWSQAFVLLLNRRKRALHDYLAETVVVKESFSHKRSLLLGVGFSMLALFWNGIIFWGDVGYLRFYAEKGDRGYQKTLGLDYYKGFFGIPRNFVFAAEWLNKAAAQEDAVAQYYLGTMCEKGMGMKVDEKKAREWYLRSSKNGYYPAKMALDSLDKKGRN